MTASRRRTTRRRGRSAELTPQQIARAGKTDERRYYPIVRDWLEQLLKREFPFCHLEITANRTFSNDIKAHILQGREIIFHFLKQTAPDITGFVDQSRGSGFVVADVKIRTITLEDVY